MSVRVLEDAVDQLRVRAVVLVNLEAHGARVEQGVERVIGARPGVRLQTDIDGPFLERRERPLHGPRRLLEARGDERRDPRGECRWDDLRRDQMDVAVNDAGRRDHAITDDRLGMRADGQVDAVADLRVARSPDTDHPPVLDADVRLDDADCWVGDDGTDQDRVQLARTGRRPLRLLEPDRFAVAP